MAERVGFEPTWGVSPHQISSLRRYDRFGTSPRASLLGVNTVNNITDNISESQLQTSGNKDPVIKSSTPGLKKPTQLLLTQIGQDTAFCLHAMIQRGRVQ